MYFSIISISNYLGELKLFIIIKKYKWIHLNYYMTVLRRYQRHNIL